VTPLSARTSLGRVFGVVVATGLMLVGLSWDTPAAQAATASVQYLDANQTTQTVKATIIDGTESSPLTLTSGWYVVQPVSTGSSPVTIDSRWVIQGDVKIIVPDGLDFRVVNQDSSTAAAIEVATGNSLTVYGQSALPPTDTPPPDFSAPTAGALVGNSNGVSNNAQGAGVGGAAGEDAGTITVVNAQLAGTSVDGCGIGGGAGASGAQLTVQGGIASGQASGSGSGIGASAATLDSGFILGAAMGVNPAIQATSLVMNGGVLFGLTISGALAIDANTTLPSTYYWGSMDINTGALAPWTTCVSGTCAPGPAPDFTTLTNVWVQAPGVHTLTVTAGNGGSVSGTSGSYPSGAKIVLKATPKAGYAFTGWTTSHGGSFANKSSASTTFTMPNTDTTVKASFRPAGTIYDTGGSPIGPTSTGCLALGLLTIGIALLVWRRFAKTVTTSA